MEEHSFVDRQKHDAPLGRLSTSALLCVDLQVGFTRGRNPLFEADRLLQTVETLQRAARFNGQPVLHVRFDGPAGHVAEKNSRGWLFDETVQPATNEIVVGKQSCDSFFQSDLNSQLQKLGVCKLYVVGCITELCIESTARSAASRGYDVSVISDAHSTPDAKLPGCPAPSERIRWFNHVMSRIGDALYRLDVKDSSTVIQSWRESGQFD